MLKEPEFTYQKELSDYVMDVLTLLIFLGNAALILYALSSLPEHIPMHINFSNQIDGYGSKYMLLVPSGIGLFLCSLLYFLENRKGFYKDNMGRIKTQEQYRLSMKTIISLKPLLAYVFLVISLLMFQTAQYKWVAYSNYFLLPVLFPFPFHFIYWFYKYSKVS